MSYLQVAIWVISVICAIYTIVKLSKLIKENEERIKKTYNTTEEQVNILKRLAEEKRQKQTELEQEIIELLKGYADNDIEFNLLSLFNYFEENGITYITRPYPYPLDEYRLDIELYNHDCYIICKKLQDLSIVRIIDLVIENK